MKDPFAHHANDVRDKRLAADPQVVGIATRLFWLRIGTGLVALGLITAVWIGWRWG